MSVSVLAIASVARCEAGAGAAAPAAAAGEWCDPLKHVAQGQKACSISGGGGEAKCLANQLWLWDRAMVFMFGGCFCLLCGVVIVVWTVGECPVTKSFG